jgi:hypothetical protein
VPLQFAADRDVTPAVRSGRHRIHCIDHQIHEHLLQEHRIAMEAAGIRGQVDGHFDVPLPNIVGDQRKSVADNFLQIDLLFFYTGDFEAWPDGAR